MEEVFKLVAPEKTHCPKGHLFTAKTEGRKFARMEYADYEVRVCKVCAEAYQQARKRAIRAMTRKNPAFQRKGRKRGTKPPVEELSSLIQVFSWTDLGIRYGVSDTAVRKWAKGYGLLTDPRPTPGDL